MQREPVRSTDLKPVLSNVVDRVFDDDEIILRKTDC